MRTAPSWLLKMLVAASVLMGHPSLDANAQSRLEIIEPGPGRAGSLLTELLTAPYTVRLPDVRQLEIPADSSFDRTLVVLGSDLMFAGTVNGDLVVVGGDLYLRPGASVSGRAVAFGGGVYPARVGDSLPEMLAFRNVTYDLRLGDRDAIGLVYRSLARDYTNVFSLPGLYGLRIPVYDRVNGLSVSVGPRLRLLDERLTLDPTLAYRSDLGEVDPALTAAFVVGGNAVTAQAGRGTFSNDGWSRPDVLNSFASLSFGGDTRNYWRAWRLEGMVSRDHMLAIGQLSTTAGVRWEDARSVGPESGTRSGPWSLIRSNDEIDGMLRPNPPVMRGSITSALVEGTLSTFLGDMTSRSTLRLEAPLSAADDSRWVQGTLDAELTMPTFGNQLLLITTHAMATAGDTPPPQRWAYLGGGATLATMDLLQQGGDVLLYIDAAYVVPLPQPLLPMVGPPVFALRYAVGGAGVGSLPSLTQNVGGGIGFSMLRLDLLVDPSTGRTSFGLSVSPFR